MVFKAAFIAHVPDAEPEKHQWMLETAKYQFFVRFVRNQDQALEASKQLATEEGIHSILLCPGFTHGEIAEIAETVGENVGVTVARGDGPSNRVTMKVLSQEGWFARE